MPFYGLCLLGFNLGILILVQLPVTHTDQFIFLIAFSCCFFPLFLKQKPLKHRIFSILVIGLLLGCAFASLSIGLFQRSVLPESLEKQTLTIRAEVDSLPKVGTHNVKFVLQKHCSDVDAENNPADAGQVHSEWCQQLPKKILVSSNLLPAGEWVPGRVGDFTVSLQRPRGLMNPGGFDYEAWLIQNRVGATGWVKEVQWLNKRQFNLHWFRYQLRQWILSYWPEAAEHWSETSKIDQPAISSRNDFPKGVAVLLALIIGDRSLISDSLWQVFVNTGTAHLMAISGLHIGLVFLVGQIISQRLLTFCLRFSVIQSWIPTPLLASSAFALLLAFGYAALAGFSLPTQRALFMLGAWVIPLMLRCQWSAWYRLLLALTLVQLFEPLSSIGMGFWLSFVAVAALLLLSNLSSGEQGIKKWVLPQLALTGLSLPWSVEFLGALVWVSPLVNLVAVPLVGMVMIPLMFLLLSMALGLHWLNYEDWAFVLLNAVAHLFDGLVACLEWVDVRPWPMQLSSTLFWSGVLMAALLWLLPLSRWMRLMASLICLAPVMADVMLDEREAAQDQLKVTVLDVGQGLAVLLQTGDKTMLYDTGGQLGQFNVAEGVVIPSLYRLGVKHLDLLVVSHSDLDHAGGMQVIQDHFPVAQQIDSFCDNDEPESVSLCAKSHEHFSCQAGQQWWWGEVHFEVLSPFHSMSNGDHNDHSCVIKVSAYDQSVLLTGDIEADAERRLLKQNRMNLAADILLVPHHGSKTSSTIGFVNHVSPSLAIVSAGYQNRFGHPHPEVVDRYTHREIPLVNTAETGALQIILRENQLPELIPWRKITKKWWRL